MSIPDHNLNAPFNIVRCSHILLNVLDLEKSLKFYRDIMGLHVDCVSEDFACLRGMEERNHSLILKQSENSQCSYIGFRAADEAEIDKIYTWFSEQGLPADFSEDSIRGRVLRVTDNMGIKIEFCARFEKLERLTQKYNLYKGVHPLRIDHFNCFSPDVQASTDFYSAMGFRVTEYTETDDDDPKLWAAWMHRKGGVHDIAFTNGKGPRLHHVAYWVPNAMNIIHLCDVMSTTGYLENLERGPGRHGVSNAFFLYIRDPDNHRIEIYCSDYLTVDPDCEAIRWTMSDTQRQTLWGMPAPISWFNEGSVFPDTKLQEPLLKTQPIVAH